MRQREGGMRERQREREREGEREREREREREGEREKGFEGRKKPISNKCLIRATEREGGK